MIFSFYETVLLFFIYAFLGWCVEVAFVAVTLGKVVNRGFLNGPICPIYGCGMLGVLTALLPVKENVILLFLGGMIICSAVELFGGWVLDKIFHMRWWDYSDRPFNIGGYICLPFSIMWGFAVVFAVKFVHTPIMKLVRHMPKLAQIIVIIVFSIAFIIDMIVTLKNLIGIKKNIGQLDKIAEELHGIGDQLKDLVGNSAIEVANVTVENKDKLIDAVEDSKEKIIEAVEDSKEKFIEAVEERKEKTEIEKLEFRRALEERKEKTEANKQELRKAWKERKEKTEADKQELRTSLEKRKEELELRCLEYTEKINKKRKYIRNSFVSLNKSGKSIKILEYIKDLKK